MSNTGLKGISRIDRNDPLKQTKHGYQVYVGWEGLEDRAFVPDHRFRSRTHALQFAINKRNGMERNWDKPRTERHIRASGVTPNTSWTR